MTNSQLVREALASADDEVANRLALPEKVLAAQFASVPNDEDETDVRRWVSRFTNEQQTMES